MEKLWSNCGGTPSRGTDGTLSLQKKVKIVSLHGLENAFLRNLLQLNFCASSAIEHGNKCWLNRRWITMKSRIKKRPRRRVFQNIWLRRWLKWYLLTVPIWIFTGATSTTSSLRRVLVWWVSSSPRAKVWAGIKRGRGRKKLVLV